MSDDFCAKWEPFEKLGVSGYFKRGVYLSNSGTGFYFFESKRTKNPAPIDKPGPFIGIKFKNFSQQDYDDLTQCHKAKMLSFFDAETINPDLIYK